MHICFVIYRYPNPVRPFSMNFVQQLAWSMSDAGHKVTVISPIPVTIMPKSITVPYHIVERTDAGNTVDVFYPKTIGFGQSHKILGKSPVGLTVKYMLQAAEKVFESLPEKPDVLYGHFLAPSGVVVAQMGKKYGIPAFFACGEAHDTIGQYGAKRAREDLLAVNGIVSVSSELKNYLLKNEVISEDKIAVIPNGYNENRFKHIEKAEARKKLGFSQDDVIAVFIGAFNERKGVLRVCEAVERVGTVKLICAGHGDQQPYGKNLLAAGQLLPSEVPLYYYAADFFVLPTLAEGCSNAVVEAIGCGLPVISSNLPFNDDILSDEYSIRIDPMNIDELEKAIRTLTFDSELRARMAEAAKKKARELTLAERTRKILAFIECKK